MERFFLDRETIPVCHVFEEIFLGLLPECYKIFLGGGWGARGGVGFRTESFKTVMQAIKRERVSVHETKMGFGFP
jgi:hypothetical protein